ncbi:MAG: DUF3343 domain-containing protein [Oscillospiraceae bacterium]|nr:DUF3343 domain-containing protein [Oscillospiraceae bacterium]
MKFYYITFRSITFAQQGDRLLSRKGIRCTLLRTPRWMEAQGCGYCLRLWTGDIQPALEILRRKQVPLRRVYIQMPDGQLEERSL